MLKYIYFSSAGGTLNCRAKHCNMHLFWITSDTTPRTTLTFDSRPWTVAQNIATCISSESPRIPPHRAPHLLLTADPELSRKTLQHASLLNHLGYHTAHHTYFWQQFIWSCRVVLHLLDHVLVHSRYLLTTPSPAHSLAGGCSVGDTRSSRWETSLHACLSFSFDATTSIRIVLCQHFAATRGDPNLKKHPLDP
jgi:hypothetical protein